jgi:2-dehydropantoate 2-reductase
MSVPSPISYCARLFDRKRRPNTLSNESATDNFDSMTDTPILIAGAGAIGSILGGKLHDAGRDVTLLGRRAHLDAIAHNGLKISGLLGDRIVAGMKLADHPAKVGKRFGLILCTVKSYDTESIAAAIADRLLDDGVVVSMQNGLGNIESLIETFGRRRVLGARVIFGAEMPSPGCAHVTVFAQPVAIGPVPALHRGDSPALAKRARAIAAMIDAAGVPTVSVDDIMPVLWTKILYNVALNPLGALLRQNYGALAADPDVRPIMDRAIDEAFAVARAIGVAIPFSSAAEYRKVFYEQLLPPTVSHRPTMLHDLHVRGRTDIAALNGRIVELADRLGVDAETNRMLTRLIRAAERVTKKKEDR